MGYEFKKLKQIYYYYFKNMFCDYFWLSQSNDLDLIFGMIV
jgi:hypothetical protein